jgi:hypothetical protein
MGRMDGKVAFVTGAWVTPEDITGVALPLDAGSCLK